MKLLNIHNVASHYRAPLFRELGRRHRQRVIFFQGDKSWREQFNPMDRQGYESVQLSGPLRLPRLAAELFFGDYDLLLMIFNGKIEPLMALAAARLRGKPCILWNGLWDLPRNVVWRLAGLVLGRFYRAWDGVICYGGHMRRGLLAYGMAPSRIFIAPQTVDNALYLRAVPKPRIRALRKAWGAQRCKVALFVGRLVQDKGLDYLLQAMAQLPKGQWKLVLVGRGPMEEALKASGALLAGHVAPESLADYYAAADVLVLPSVTGLKFREPWGLVVNEAYCQALPVIATDAVGAAMGGLAEHGRSALVVPERDAGALAAALARLGRDKGLARRLGREGMRRVRQRTYQSMADHFEDAFERLHQPLL